MIVAFLSVNTGVTIMAATLVASQATLGLGLGLFGVLSIIRLRSRGVGQREVAYYFASLILGLLGGLGVFVGPLAFVGMAAIVAVLAIADHPRLLPGYETQEILLDRAIPNRTALVAHLESLLGGQVHEVNVKRLDMIKKTTLVEVSLSRSALNLSSTYSPMSHDVADAKSKKQLTTAN